MYGYTALMKVSSNDHIVKLLLSNNANVNLQNNDEYNALMTASLYGHKKADVNLKGKHNFTALIYASIHGHKKADVNLKGKHNFTALIYASIHGVVKLLLANVNLKNNYECFKTWSYKYSERIIRSWS
jgi:ankyrin repeat protein